MGSNFGKFFAWQAKFWLKDLEFKQKKYLKSINHRSATAIVFNADNLRWVNSEVTKKTVQKILFLKKSQVFRNLN